MSLNLYPTSEFTSSNLKNIRAKVKHHHLHCSKRQNGTILGYSDDTVLPILDASARLENFEVAHRARKGSDGKYQCAACPKNYTSGTNLKYHFLQIHLGFRSGRLGRRT
jgi:hypothetical protein